MGRLLLRMIRWEGGMTGVFVVNVVLVDELFVGRVEGCRCWGVFVVFVGKS